MYGIRSQATSLLPRLWPFSGFSYCLRHTDISKVPYKCIPLANRVLSHLRKRLMADEADDDPRADRHQAAIDRLRPGLDAAITAIRLVTLSFRLEKSSRFQKLTKCAQYATSQSPIHRARRTRFVPTVQCGCTCNVRWINDPHKENRRHRDFSPRQALMGLWL